MNKFKKKSQAVREIVQHPDINVMADTLSKNTEGLEGLMPHVHQSLQTVGARALNYLNSKLPNPQSSMPGDKEYEPSKSEQRSWLNMHDIVDNPLSALDHVRHGTLTSDHMDALQNVHPEMLDAMRKEVMSHMNPNKLQKLSGSTKEALGTFLGQPVSQNHSPQALLSNQAVFQSQPQAQQQQAKGQKSTLGGLKELKIGERASTETQDLEEMK